MRKEAGWLLAAIYIGWGQDLLLVSLFTIVLLEDGNYTI